MEPPRGPRGQGLRPHSQTGCPRNRTCLLRGETAMSAAPKAPAAQVSAPDEGASQVKGEFVLLDGESFYRIADYDALDPFFMTLASDADHWLFVSSNGCLTAGRKNSQNALFPY